MGKIGIFVGVILLFSLSLCFAQEEVVITTYYPSPYGVYKDLKVEGAVGNEGTFEVDPDGTAGNSDEFIVNSSGNVGIGTTTPGAYRLYVNGNMYVNGDITTDADTYPDYVFEPGYKLMSIKELKQFVLENKHLPNMQSREEVKKEGIKIFEQNRLMMEKLEEAYLYIIELQDRVNKLEKH
ncbi:MAG: hypothetical protein KJ838_03060 [Candidatus Omnitrophica bacterium]|nr:hypothetical protein [Candidatus Omnitrophota bacterium]